jgi:hypothetical protein
MESCFRVIESDILAIVVFDIREVPAIWECPEIDTARKTPLTLGDAENYGSGNLFGMSSP